MGQRRAKRVKYEAVPPEHPAYEMLMKVIAHQHPELAEARFSLQWRKELKPDVDDRLVLGKIAVLGDSEREDCPYDIRLALNEEAFNEFTDAQRQAVIDHFLCRVRVKRDEQDEPKKDERGRTLYRKRQPDVAEFSEIIERHGLYLDQLARFAEKLAEKRRMPLFADLPETPPGDDDTAAANGEAFERPEAAKPKRPRRRSKASV